MWWKKTGKWIRESSRLEFLEKFLANNFALSDAEDNTSGLLNRRGITDLPLFRTLLAICQRSCKPSFWEVINSCFISICKFGSFKNCFATITSLPELYFRLRRFILLVETRKVISMNYGSSTSSWKPWRGVRLDLILMMKDIYINSNLNPLTNLPIEHLSNDHKDCPNQCKNSHKLCDETGHPIVNLMESQWKLRKQHDQNYPMASEERHKSKRAGMWKS